MSMLTAGYELPAGFARGYPMRLLLILTLLLAACGGGDPEPEPDPPDVNCNVIPRPEACA